MKREDVSQLGRSLRNDHGICTICKSSVTHSSDWLTCGGAHGWCAVCDLLSPTEVLHRHVERYTDALLESNAPGPSSRKSRCLGSGRLGPRNDLLHLAESGMEHTSSVTQKLSKVDD